MKFKTQEELLRFTRGILGKKFKDIDEQNLLATKKKDKGILGKVVETGFYGYELNSNPEADFAELGIELKVAGFKKNKNDTISAKERLVLSKIDYCKMIEEEFEFSKLLFKNKKLLIIWYEYDYDNKDNYGDFEIKYYQIYDMEIDEDIFKNDFNTIKNKVLNGEAHLLSEGDTSYLGACTKGTKGTDIAKQPKSSIPAKPRAYSLKNGYMTGILRSIDFESQVPSEFKTAQSYVYDKFKPYFGLTQLEIWSKVGDYEIDLTKGVPKNLNKMISDRIIGKDEELGSIDDVFNKVTYAIKSIPVNKKNYPVEMMKFKNIYLDEFNEEWDNSSWKDYFEEINLIVIIYEAGSSSIKNGDRVLRGIKSITFTAEDIDKMKISYEMIQDAIITRDISKLPYLRVKTDIILGISPKGLKGDKAYENFFTINKTGFALSKEFINSKIN